jgi:hypothetical protein
MIKSDGLDTEICKSCSHKWISHAPAPASFLPHRFVKQSTAHNGRAWYQSASDSHTLFYHVPQKLLIEFICSMCSSQEEAGEGWILADIQPEMVRGREHECIDDVCCPCGDGNKVTPWKKVRAPMR